MVQFPGLVNRLQPRLQAVFLSPRAATHLAGSATALVGRLLRTLTVLRKKRVGLAVLEMKQIDQGVSRQMTVLKSQTQALKTARCLML